MYGVKKFFFSENLACFVFLKHAFWDSPFGFITDKFLDEILWNLNFHMRYEVEIEDNTNESFYNFSL